MIRYIEFPLEEGGTIVVEVEQPKPEFGAIQVGRPDAAAEKATRTFSQALEQIQPAISAAVDKLRGLQPDELSVEFGIKLNAQAGAFLASAGTEANFKVSIKWQSQPQPTTT